MGDHPHDCDYIHKNLPQHTRERDSPAGFEEVSCHVVRGLHGKEPWWPSESDP